MGGKTSKNQVPSPEVNGGAEINSTDDRRRSEFIEPEPAASETEINVRDDRRRSEFIEPEPAINTESEINVRDDQTTYESIEPAINNEREANVRDDQTTYESIEPAINNEREANVRDDQTTYESIEPAINTAAKIKVRFDQTDARPGTSGTNPHVERRILPPRAAKDKSIFGNRGRSDRNDVKSKEPHGLRAKRAASCDSALGKHKASVSESGQEMKRRQASQKGERRILPPRAAKHKSVYGNIIMEACKR